jgi:hypothetical protein
MTFEVNLAQFHADELWAHLFPGDDDEHAAVMLAAAHMRPDRTRLLVRELHLLHSDEFIPGEHGYRQLTPGALARLGNRAAAERLALISCHSHPGAGATSVSFSRDDLAGHRRVFPHLLDIIDGQPVVGLALAERAATGEVWTKDGQPEPLTGLRVVGHDLRMLTPGRMSPRATTAEARFDRQARMFGADGQAELGKLHVAVVGLGGGGSMISEQLVHLGVGAITAIDYDVVEEHNLSRVVGASANDARHVRKKVHVAERLAKRIDPGVSFKAIDGDIADDRTAAHLLDVDFIFLATDSMTSRHVANAIVHAYLIPMIQVGAKVDLGTGGRIESVYVAIRPVFPRRGCLHCAGMVDADALQHEAASEQERRAQNYLDLPETIDPSVVTLNAIAASTATNAMLMATVGLAGEALLDHRLLDARHGSWLALKAKHNESCPWCGSSERSRFARGEHASLPVRLSPPELVNASRLRLGSRLRVWTRRLTARLR